MRQVRRLICLLYLGYSGLWACTGTEVGNGARPTDPDGDKVPSTTGEQLPESSGSGSTNTNTNTDTMGNESTGTAHVLPYLFASCASPLVEAGASSFTTPDVYQLKVVDQGVNWRVDISQHVPVASGVVKAAATGSEPYALTVVDAQTLPIAKNYACSAVSSETTSVAEGEQTKRTMTVTTENGAATIQWILLKSTSGSAKVTEIQVKTTGMIIFRRDP